MVAILVIVQRLARAEFYSAHGTLVLEHVGEVHALHVVTHVAPILAASAANLTDESERLFSAADAGVGKFQHVHMQVTWVLGHTL